MTKLQRTIFAIFAACSVHQAMAAEDAIPNWKEDTLTGDWGGARTELYKKGVNLGFTHKSDILSNVSGGLEHGTAWLGHTEARLGLDLEKLLGWNGTTAYVVYQSDLGSKFNSRYVGAFTGVDNIEVGTNTAQFYQAWVQKNFANDHISVLAGLYPIDTEFYMAEEGAIFIQPPYGMANEVAQTGINGPAIFPLGALAVRVKLTSPSDNFYVQGAVTDGVPGDPNNPRGTHVQLGGGDGTFSIIEFGYTPHEEAMKIEQAEHREMTPAQLNVHEQAEIFNKTAIGFWRYSSRFDDISAVDAAGDPKRRSNQGAYIVAERTLFLESGHPSQGLAGFMRFGVADEDVNQSDWSSSIGLRYHGLINGRDDDIAGVAITVNHAGDKYRTSVDAESKELNFEATYRAQISPYFAVQPTVQYITNPSMDAAIKNVWVIGSRLEFEF